MSIYYYPKMYRTLHQQFLLLPYLKRNNRSRLIQRISCLTTINAVLDSYIAFILRESNIRNPEYLSCTLCGNVWFISPFSEFVDLGFPCMKSSYSGMVSGFLFIWNLRETFQNFGVLPCSFCKSGLVSRFALLMFGIRVVCSYFLISSTFSGVSIQILFSQIIYFLSEILEIFWVFHINV